VARIRRSPPNNDNFTTIKQKPTTINRRRNYQVQVSLTTGTVSFFSSATVVQVLNNFQRKFSRDFGESLAILLQVFGDSEKTIFFWFRASFSAI